MYIPSELGYGDSGSPPKIGGGDALIFKMEILEIQGGKVPGKINASRPQSQPSPFKMLKQRVSRIRPLVCTAKSAPISIHFASQRARMPNCDVNKRLTYEYPTP